jgi:hypothetical protein
MGNAFASITAFDGGTITVSSNADLPGYPFVAQVTPSRATPLPGDADVEVMSLRRISFGPVKFTVLARAQQGTSQLDVQAGWTVRKLDTVSEVLEPTERVESAFVGATGATGAGGSAGGQGATGATGAQGATGAALSTPYESFYTAAHSLTGGQYDLLTWAKSGGSDLLDLTKPKFVSAGVYALTVSVNGSYVDVLVMYGCMNPLLDLTAGTAIPLNFTGTFAAGQQIYVQCYATQSTTAQVGMYVQRIA